MHSFKTIFVWPLRALTTLNGLPSIPWGLTPSAAQKEPRFSSLQSRQSLPQQCYRCMAVSDPVSLIVLRPALLVAHLLNRPLGHRLQLVCSPVFGAGSWMDFGTMLQPCLQPCFWPHLLLFWAGASGQTMDLVHCLPCLRSATLRLFPIDEGTTCAGSPWHPGPEEAASPLLPDFFCHSLYVMIPEEMLTTYMVFNSAVIKTLNFNNHRIIEKWGLKEPWEVIQFIQLAPR